MWEHPDSGAQMRALTRSALGDEAGGDRIRDLVLEVTTAPAFDHLLGSNRTGLTLAMAHLLGVACVRHLARIPPLPDLGFDELVARTAPAVQLHLNADTGR
ncbi:MAG: hypothetical protein KDA37_15380, partial [Planctomycetales bacterium]|nr:hypothetical protein [Planctomycetales bacterium]